MVLENNASLNNNKILEITLHKAIANNCILLMAINLKDFSPRILTGIDDKRYLVFFSKLEQVKLGDSAISILAQPSLEALKYAATSELDGVIINPWGKRITIPLILLRHIYYSFLLKEYFEDCWWNSPAVVQDFEALMWNNSDPYDELWLEELLAKQNQKTITVAWWAKEQPQIYKKPPLFMQVWLAFYGLYWLQTIFTAGLNTLYYKEIDEANIYLSAILSVGIFFIFKYLHKFNDWWYKREEIRKNQAEQLLWEAGKEERERQRLAEEATVKKAQEIKHQQLNRELKAIEILKQDFSL